MKNIISSIKYDWEMAQVFNAAYATGVYNMWYDVGFLHWESLPPGPGGIETDHFLPRA